MPRITASWFEGPGQLRPGTWRLVLLDRLCDTAGNVIHPAGLWDDGALTTTTRSLDVTPPNGVPLRLVVRFTSGQGEDYTVAAGSTDIDLSDVVLPSIPHPDPVLIRGVAGGVAGLDADGDVIDADGVKVTGGGGAAVTHTQSSPLATWTISHSLARLPVVAVYVGGAEVLADVEATTTTATVTFAAPASGVAVLV